MFFPFGKNTKLFPEKSREELEDYYQNQAPSSDFLALMLAACRTILPFTLVVLGAIVGVAWLLFLR